MVQNHFSNVLFRKLLFMDVDKMDINSLKSQFSKYKKDLLDLNKYMYENPELGYQEIKSCLLYTSPSPRDRTRSRMPSSA